MLLTLCCALPQVLRGQGEQGRSKPLYVLVGDGAVRHDALERAIRDVASEHALPLTGIDIRDHPSPYPPPEGLPITSTWDLAVLIPGFLVDRAESAGRLRGIPADAGSKERVSLLTDVVAYGFVTIRDGVFVRPWEQFDRSEILSVPNIELEPTFVDVLARLRATTGAVLFDELWGRSRSVLTSAELRKQYLEQNRRLEAGRQEPIGRQAIVRLTDEEIDNGLRLWTARLSSCVSRDAPPFAVTLLTGLCAKNRIESWLGRRPRLSRYSAHLMFPPTSTEVDEAYAGLFRRGATISDTPPDWWTTALIAIGAGLFGIVIWSSSRKKTRAQTAGSRVSGSR
ncbi:MAG: hypothetical protein KDC95_11380 [Planctomycetes bacterium]|nr:hypothetical protein [Planctomycetota bacterium]